MGPEESVADGVSGQPTVKGLKGCRIVRANAANHEPWQAGATIHYGTGADTHGR